MDPIRLVIEIADGVVRVTAPRPVEVLLVRYDDLLADPRSEECSVAVSRARVAQLFRDLGDAAGG